MGYQFFTKKIPASNQPIVLQKEGTSPIKNFDFKIEDTIPDSSMNFKGYQKYLGSLKKTDLNSIQKGLKAFRKNQILFSQQEKDKALSYYQDFFYGVIRGFRDKVYNDELERLLEKENSSIDGVYYVNDLLDLLNDPQKPKKDPRVQALIKLMHHNGLQFDMSEGNIYISIQPDFLYKNFQPYLSIPYQEFLAIEKKEKAERCTEDAGLRISFDELGNRIIIWENFLKEYPDFEFNKEIREKNNWYLKLFLRGLNNSPLFSYSDDLLNPEIKIAYENYIQKNGESQSGKLVKGFYDLLQTEGFKRNEKIEQYYDDNHLGW